MLDGKLDTGMKASEAIQRANHWWETKGRKMMRQHKMRQGHSAGAIIPGLNGAFASTDPDNESFLPANILHGLPWDDLDKREKLQITKIWHHFYIRVPEKIGDEEHEFKFNGNNDITN